jgi:UDP-glucose 4-epimerase
MTHPWLYYRENVDGMLSLLAAMREVDVRRLVYSSSAAVYGNQDRNPIEETFVLDPTSPYGETKVIGEWLARSAGVVDRLSWVSLRYFNVAGAAEPALGDPGVTNLIPMVFEAIDEGRPPQIFGADYPTPDGTCIRDFVHVVDLARAHASAAAFVEAQAGAEVLNVGCGRGASVREVMAVIERVTGTALNPQIAPRRPGDIEASVASVERIARVLDWRATHGLDDMVESAWRAWLARSTGAGE